MKVATHLLAAVVAAVVILLPLARRLPSMGRDFAVVELIHTRQAIQREIADISLQLVQQLSALGTAISKDRDFSMKLLVERDPSAPEVTELASKYMTAMGLQVLDVTDDKHTVLSSGHFPARAGVSAAAKVELLGPEAIFVIDDLRGVPVLTLQAKAAFTCADVPFYCMGGIVADSAFLRRLSPREGVRVLLKRGAEVTGVDSVTTMSEVKNNSIIINDETYLAASLSLPTAEDDMETTQIIVVVEEPAKTSLFALF
jgi:hypothetical protein